MKCTFTCIESKEATNYVKKGLRSCHVSHIAVSATGNAAVQMLIYNSYMTREKKGGLFH